MRYWKQCSSTADSGFFGEEGMEQDEPAARDANGEVIAPWKADAIEGDEQEFPSIASKIKQMEEDAKKPLAMYEVPDVKGKMRTGAPAAKWMEARGKLQCQLDTLITKTSEKMAKYASIHARVKDDFAKDSSAESEDAGSQSSRPATPKEVVDKQVKSLIKTVASEIQKSFSKKSIHALDDEEEKEESDEEEEEEEETEEERERREEAMRRREEERRKREERDNARKAKRVIKEARKRQRHIDVEAPILDFELKEPTPEPEPESEEEDDHTEAPVDFNSPAAAINLSAARSKIDMGRAKKRAAERAKGPKHAAAFTEIELIVAEKLHRKEKFSDKVMQTQWEISNADYELSRLSDNEKADMLTKQISKMKSKHVTKLLKSIDSGVLDISLPMLVPFLSLQARMSLGTDLHKNRFKQEDAAGKNKMVKETFVDTMLKDITDIALLQEIIERSQEKLQILAAEDEKRFAEKMRKQMVNIENDSFELGSSPPLRAASPIFEKSSTPVRSVTPAGKKETSPEIEVSHESVKEESGGETTSAVANKNSSVRKSGSSKEGEDAVPFGISDVLSDEEEEEEEVKKSEAKKSDDEGCGSSESDDDKEETKKAQSKAEESDEGIGKSDDNVSKDEEEVKVEEEEEAPKNNIKSKILNIIQDAKAMDQKRNIRNHGRNFEFQGMKEALKPVLPNDRRPTKAKRLDSMWTNVTAAKQRYNDPPAPSLEELKSRQKKAAPALEELKNKPKSNVPWTRKGNAQPVKKEILAEEKEVKEFESCRKTLKDNVKIESAEKNTRNVQAVKKNETTAPAVKESNEEVEIGSGKSCEKVKMVDNEEKTEINAIEVVEIEKDSSEKVADTAITEKASCSGESAKTEA